MTIGDIVPLVQAMGQESNLIIPESNLNQPSCCFVKISWCQVLRLKSFGSTPASVFDRLNCQIRTGQSFVWCSRLNKIIIINMLYSPLSPGTQGLTVLSNNVKMIYGEKKNICTC